jgi:hypothetical protein
MPRPKAEPPVELLVSLAGLPEEEGWAILRHLHTAPYCSLLGDLAITSSEVEKLVGLRETLNQTSFWLSQIAAAPACPLEISHDSSCQFI